MTAKTNKSSKERDNNIIEHLLYTNFIFIIIFNPHNL